MSIVIARVNYYLRHCADEVFGKERFVNEIVWKRTVLDIVTTNIPKNADYIYLLFKV